MKNLILSSVLAILICSCDHSDFPIVNSLPIDYEMPLYSVNNKEGYIDKDEVVNKVFIFNSSEEVKRELTEVFLNEYPSYLDVDFSKYSLLVKTIIIDYFVIGRKIDYYVKHEELNKSFVFWINYDVGEKLSDNEYLIERIAIVVDKIEEDKIVNFGYSYSQKNQKGNGSR